MKESIVLITNMPVPYRVPVFDLLALDYTGFHVVYCSRRESNRGWLVDVSSHNHVFLNEKSKQKADGYNYVHSNLDVWKVLNELRPSIVITTGFYPTQLIAFLWAKLHFAKHLVMTDGWLGSEAHLGIIHKLVRKVVFSFTTAFIGASNGSLKLFASYGLAESAIFKSVLPIVKGDSSEFEWLDVQEREFDILFVGRLEEPKNVQLAIEACIAAEKLIGRAISVRVVGDGSLFGRLKKLAKQSTLKIKFDRFIPPLEMFEVYRSAKILLLPTQVEAWGLVIAEAMAEGVVPIISNKTAAAGELVLDNINGNVLANFDTGLWASSISNLLNNVDLLTQYSKCALESVKPYSVEAAALGLKKAIDYAKF